MCGRETFDGTFAKVERAHDNDDAFWVKEENVRLKEENKKLRDEIIRLRPAPTPVRQLRPLPPPTRMPEPTPELAADPTRGAVAL